MLVNNLIVELAGLVFEWDGLVFSPSLIKVNRKADVTPLSD